MQPVYKQPKEGFTNVTAQGITPAYFNKTYVQAQ